MRAGYLDALRGTAVIWMVIFHTSYDLRMFGFVNWNFTEGFWFAFPRVIAFTFLFCVGVSLNFAHRNGINRKALKERTIKLGLSALAVSVGTYFIFPSQWIYFGTLHCILAGSILGTFLVGRRKLATGLMIVIVLLQYGAGYDIKWVSSILQKPSMDFIPIYPWFWAILLGMAVEPYLTRSQILRDLPVPRGLSFLGKHSLKIYLLHQPIIYGVIMLFRVLTR